MQTAAKNNRIDLLEHCEVIDFELTGQGINPQHTSQGKIFARASGQYRRCVERGIICRYRLEHPGSLGASVCRELSSERP